jgi:hypothetical protein
MASRLLIPVAIFISLYVVYSIHEPLTDEMMRLFDSVERKFQAKGWFLMFRCQFEIKMESIFVQNVMDTHRPLFQLFRPLFTHPLSIRPLFTHQLIHLRFSIHQFKSFNRQ